VRMRVGQLTQKGLWAPTPNSPTKPVPSRARTYLEQRRGAPLPRWAHATPAPPGLAWVRVRARVKANLEQRRGAQLVQRRGGRAPRQRRHDAHAQRREVQRRHLS
jgi:hypothetical protein